MRRLMRWGTGLAMGVGLLVLVPSAGWAADGEVAEAAQISPSEMSHEYIRDAIEATRATDPELAAEMERQLETLERETARDVPDAAGEPVLDGTGLGLYDTIEPGARMSRRGRGFPGEADRDPRVVELHRQLDDGEISYEAAKEQLEPILREYGIEPRAGDWQMDEGEFEYGGPAYGAPPEAFEGGLGDEGAWEGAERAGGWEHGFDQELELGAPPESAYGGHEMEYEGSEIEYEAPEVELEGPEVEVETP